MVAGRRLRPVRAVVEELRQVVGQFVAEPFAEEFRQARSPCRGRAVRVRQLYAVAVAPIVRFVGENGRDGAAEIRSEFAVITFVGDFDETLYGFRIQHVKIGEAVEPV